MPGGLESRKVLGWCRGVAWALCSKMSSARAAASADFWSRLPLGVGVEILRQDASGLAAMAKPAGVLSHPNVVAENPRALLTVDYNIEGEHWHWVDAEAGGVERRLWLLNRLDSATSGVILVAADEELAIAVRRLFRQKHIAKVYQGLVFGTPPLRREIWQDRLSTARRGGRVRTDRGGNVPASAVMTLVRQARDVSVGLSLLQLEPRTGRSHQLRVQCAERHLPIVGDANYGDFRLNKEFAKRTGEKRLFLHSLSTTFDYTWKGRTQTFSATAPWPAEFGLALRG